MKKAELGMTTIIGAIIAVVSVVIGATILDSLSTSANTLTAVLNESHGGITRPINATSPMAFTLDNKPLHSLTDTVKIQTSNGNQTVSGYAITTLDPAVVTVTSYNPNQGSTLLFTYSYEGSDYINSDLGRTIIGYIPVMALLSLLGMAAFVFMRK
jgi:hypothetical protein